MKKFWKSAALCLMAVVLLSGCAMKAEYGIKVGKDKNVTLEFLVAQDNDMIDAFLNMGSSDDNSDKTHTDAERWAYIDSDDNKDDFKDFEKTKYDKDGFKGYTYSLKLGSIENLVTDSSDKLDIDAINKDSKLFTKNGETYNLNIKVSDENANEMSQYGSQVNFDVKMKVTLPNKAKSNNATTVEGNTYIWDLTKATSIDLSFDLNNKSNVLLIAGIAVGVVVVVAVCGVLLSKKKKA